MISKSQFVNKLRDLGYTYKSRQKRTDMWRKRGGTHRVFVPLADLLEDEYVVSTLRQAGCNGEQIKTFIASAKS